MVLIEEHINKSNMLIKGGLDIFLCQLEFSKQEIHLTKIKKDKSFLKD